MKVEIQNLDEVVRRLDRLAREQVPYATALALTKTAQAAQAATRAEMTRVFDRPTPFTLASTFIRPATKSRLEAQVFLKDLDNKGGGSARTRLAPQVYGGTRRWKRMEGLLMRTGLMAPGEVAVPGEAAKLDAYGNMSRGQLVQILSWFQAFPESGYKANTTREGRSRLARGSKTRRGVRYFFRRDRPGRGVYQATRTAWGSAIKPVLMFAARPAYSARFDMPGVVERVARQQFRGWFASAAEEAMRSAR